MKIGDLLIIDGVKYRVLKQGSNNFCLNNLEKGGTICHVAWTLDYLKNYFAKEAITYNVSQRTTGIYNL